MKPTFRNAPCIDVCNILLRGEISAVEAYDQAIRKFAGHPVVTALERMRDEHRESVMQLRANVASLGGKPSRNSGAWGGIARVLGAAAMLLGEAPAIATLRQGEEFGIDQYLATLGDPDVTEDLKTLVSTRLLPRLRTHIRALAAIAA